MMLQVVGANCYTDFLFVEYMALEWKPNNDFPQIVNNLSPVFEIFFEL